MHTREKNNSKTRNLAAEEKKEKKKEKEKMSRKLKLIQIAKKTYVRTYVKEGGREVCQCPLCVCVHRWNHASRELINGICFFLS